MIESPFARRLVTIPVLYLLFAALTFLLPAVLTIAAAIDLLRWLGRRRSAMSLRIITFGWLYLLGECWAVVSMAVVGFLPQGRSVRATFMLQRVWLDWNFDSLRLVFGLEFEVGGRKSISPGPILLLSRHASLIDTMLPGRYVVKPHGIRLRYVLKKELLVDPALDIGGNRLPNYFIDRSGDIDQELAGIRALAADMTDRDGVLIYPEGTRYSEQKREVFVERLARRGEDLGRVASGFRSVLPPRPAGALALVDATTADVVVLAHRGLEGFARVGDIWSGDLVGSAVKVRFWRVPREEIPEGRSERVRWLFELWAEVDSWVTGDCPSTLEGA